MELVRYHPVQKGREQQRVQSTVTGETLLGQVQGHLGKETWMVEWWQKGKEERKILKASRL